MLVSGLKILQLTFEGMFTKHRTHLDSTTVYVVIETADGEFTLLLETLRSLGRSEFTQSPC